eukprot:195233_1
MTTKLNYERQLQKMKTAPGFVAALDQSGGSTPKALRLYGVPDNWYIDNEQSMFDHIHMMRERIMTSQKFNGDRILAAILFEDTVNREVEGTPVARYLWEQKRIVPILKIDQGLEPEKNGVQMMKPLTKLDAMIKLAKDKMIFGTKARSFIKSANERGIRENVEQQFRIGKIVCAAGLIPILEPEVDIRSSQKVEAENILKNVLLENLNSLDPDEKVMLKLTLPTIPNHYTEVISHPNVIRVVALSGGYTRFEANSLLAQNELMVASFSRALTEGLRADDSPEFFDSKLDDSIGSIYYASVGKM